MSALKNLTGQIFGRLTIGERAPNRGNRTFWHCTCACGTSCTVGAGELADGKTRSCGCLRREVTVARGVARAKHGHCRGKKTSPEWSSWRAMMDRCYRAAHPSYALYGGRGITVCEQWRGEQGFDRFLQDMGPRSRGLSLDRIETNGVYEPSNCRWATRKQQAQNRRETPEYYATRCANLDRGRAARWGG